MHAWRWLLCFLIGFVVSLVCGYWFGGYAKRHGWTGDYVARRTALVPYSALAVALIAIRIKGSPIDPVFWVTFGFLMGGGFTVLIALRRLSSKQL